ncbi:unnamed protein product [Closterium sp. NIES-64]|nr:unnamed protein product [Closterium sp. NIES-64]
MLQAGELQPGDTVRAAEDDDHSWSSMSRDEVCLIQAALQRAKQQQQQPRMLADSAFTDPASTPGEKRTLWEPHPAFSPEEHAGLVPTECEGKSPDSPQLQAAAAQESPPGGNTGFKSPSATPSPLSQSPRRGVGLAGPVAAAGARQITGKSATEKQRRSRITEWRKALKAAIPAEVLVRQQGRAGFNNRTQIATLLEAAVGFIEGMHEYKRELQRQLETL